MNNKNENNYEIEPQKLKSKKGTTTFLIVFFTIFFLVLSFIGIKNLLINDDNNTNVDNNQQEEDNNQKENVNNNQEIDNTINNNSENDNNIKELVADLNLNKSYDKLGIEIYFENYFLIHLPRHEVDGEAVSYKVSDLTDEEISMFVWKYIWGRYEMNDTKLSDDSVNNFLKKYLNLDNYEVKELEMEEHPKEGEPWNIFGLKHEDNMYIAEVIPTEFAFNSYRVSDVKYNKETKEIYVYFEEYVNEYFIYKLNDGVATFKINETTSSPYLDNVKFNNKGDLNSDMK